MTFGWQGFRFEHPDDWAPSSVSGSEKEGYARLDSQTSLSAQIRWKSGAGDRLDLTLASYMDRLQQQSKRFGTPFRFEVKQEPDRRSYRWLGDQQGRGALFHEGGRVFFLEVLGRRNDSLLPRIRSMLDSFRSPVADARLWSVLGLRVDLPVRCKLMRYEFVAGKTCLTFQSGRTTVECVRWGLAAQLLAKRPVEDWAPAALGMTGADSEVQQTGLRLSKFSLLGKQTALIRLCESENQIITLKASYRKEKDQPQWAWIA